MKIFELSKRPTITKEAIDYFWNCWGNETNYNFYEDCVLHSLDSKNNLPKFYVGIDQDQIVASYALLINDIISRQDLYPWFACLYVNEAHRKKGFAGRLLNHGIQEAKAFGYDKLYLSTDLVNFYERKGWAQMGVGYGVTGETFKIYEKSTE